jgi:hypothetical protein
MIPPDPEAAVFSSLVAELERSWERASHHQVIEERTAEIARQPLIVRSPDITLLDVFWPALEHHPPAVGPPDLELRLWQLSSDVPPPRVPPVATQQLECISHGMDGELIGRFRFDAASRVLMAWDPQRHIAWWCAESIDEIRPWERDSPFKTIMSWWFATHDVHLAHAAAICGDHSALLLVGRGGSGKSTTSVACFFDGMGFIADDLCLVTIDPVPTVSSLYGTAKLFPHEVERLEALRPMLLDGDLATADKFVSLLGRHRSGGLQQSAPVVAVAAVSVGNEASTITEPASAGDVLTALAPSSLLIVPGAGGSAMRAFADLVRTVPCYRIVLGHDRAGVVPAIRSLLRTVEVPSP